MPGGSHSVPAGAACRVPATFPSNPFKDPKVSLRQPRIDVDIPGTLTTHDGRALPVRVRDLSTSGFRIEHDGELLAGDRVWLAADRNGPVAAQIRWALGREAGGHFLEPPRLA